MSVAAAGSEHRRAYQGHHEQPAFLVHRIEEQDDDVCREGQTGELQHPAEVVAKRFQSGCKVSEKYSTLQ